MVISAINHDITSETNNPPRVADSRHNPINEPFELKTWASLNLVLRGQFPKGIDPRERKIGRHHTVHGGWFNGRGYATLVKEKAESYELLTPQISSWDQGHYLPIVWILLRRRKACLICESTQHLKAQHPEISWNCKRKQAVTRRSRLMDTEKETLLLNSPQEMDTRTLAEDNSKPDSASVTEEKDEFQEAISTLGSVDKENIDRSDLPTQSNEDSSQKKSSRKEAIKRLLHPLVTFNSLSMNIQKRNNSEAFTPTSVVERAKKKSAFFDDV
ncbi:hypothetical protein G6F16_012613 [Rhizopus arrhizus]|nr:hypothetical protein G6F21_012447 [Rhizopus arrhizus]KAG0784847.1 hypothetical protein G6F22_008161 [Rhizopus arrhizus]KAG0810628.1 hypothetical protein G6F20_007803 [Rhizopus arrhizus]KAG0822527.1 hypothetical protein G6F19_011323 [Rhizopus arrhizus]KAG0823471.1 hypothetical protein G6F18_011300 [Rhizopus arrhizus]